MKSSKLCAIPLAVLLVAPALLGQDPVSRPALVVDPPTIVRGELTFERLVASPRNIVFTPWLAGRDDKAWLALEDEAAPDKSPPSIEVGFRERWLMDRVKERFQGVSSAETIRKVTIRSDGTSKTITGERGIEVRGTAEALAQVRDFFDRFAAESKKTVTVEVRVIAVGDAPGWTDMTSVAAAATSRDLESRLKELAARGAGQPIFSPATKVFANQTAKMSIIEQVAYIKDFDVQLVGGTKIADPVVDVVDDGFQLELTPVLDPDGGALIVSGRIRFSHLTRPIREERVKLGDTQVTIQLPEVVTRSWTGEVRLEPGQNAIRISGLNYSVPGKNRSVEVWCLVTLDDGVPAPTAGQIVDRDDKNGNVFVTFPREYVPDDPWNKAPKEVAVYRGTEKIGTARLAGGWVLGTDPEAKHAVIAIYHLDEGTPRDGDSVR